MLFRKRTNAMKNYLLPALIALSVISCTREESETVDQDRIWTSYTLEYDADDGITRAQAQFRFSNAFGTILELTEPAEVRVNNLLMNWRPVLAYYERESMGLMGSATFVYTDLNGGSYSNTLELPQSIALPDTVTSISRNQSYLLFWEGAPLQPGEIINAYLRESSGSDSRVFSTAAAGANYLTLDNDQLDDLNTGLATVQLERLVISSPDDHPGTGGLLTAKYQSDLYTITLE